jgi:CBS domain-containing protein
VGNGAPNLTHALPISSAQPADWALAMAIPEGLPFAVSLTMPKLAKDLMTKNPRCCTEDMTLHEVARLMVQIDCGEIPVVGEGNQLIGVVTDRDIVVRAVAEGKDTRAITVEECMTHPAISVDEDESLADVMSTMEKHQIRRVVVVNGAGCCVGIIAQADVARGAQNSDVGELVREVSR